MMMQSESSWKGICPSMVSSVVDTVIHRDTDSSEEMLFFKYVFVLSIFSWSMPRPSAQTSCWAASLIPIVLQ